ncbi:hypothetical protein HDU81_007520 [Chytriomyces hyalinus]|nr:hypothetical protein HDU81_007520 [Chytriomyces hyalinus]
MNQQQQLNLGLGGPSGTGGGGGPSAALSARLGLLGGLNNAGATNSMSTNNPNLGLTSGLNAMSLNSESDFPSLSSGAMNAGSGGGGVNAGSGASNNASVLQQQRLAAVFSNASIGQTLKLQMNPNQPARMQPMLPPGMVLTNPPANGLGGGGGGGGGGGPLLSLALGNKQSQFVSSLGSQQQQQQLNNAFPSMNHPSGAIGNLQQQQQTQISQFGQSIGGAIGNGPIGNHLSSISPPATNLLAQQQQQQQQQQHQLQHQQSQSALTAQSLLPSAQTNDKYGLLGVIDGLRLSSDPDTNMLSLGCELTSLGLNLNSPTPLYTTLTSVYSPTSLDMSNGTTAANGSNNHFVIPSCYRVNLSSCDISRVDQVTLMSDDALLMAFYAFPRDRVQEAAAQELHSRGWRFHKDIKVWLCKEEPASVAISGLAATPTANMATPTTTTATTTPTAAAANNARKEDQDDVKSPTASIDHVRKTANNGTATQDSDDTDSHSAPPQQQQIQQMGPKLQEIVHGDRGVFVFFDPANWQRVKKEWVVVGDVLEERMSGASLSARGAAKSGVSKGKSEGELESHDASTKENGSRGRDER